MTVERKMPQINNMTPQIHPCEYNYNLYNFRYVNTSDVPSCGTVALLVFFVTIEKRPYKSYDSTAADSHRYRTSTYGKAVFHV